MKDMDLRVRRDIDALLALRHVGTMRRAGARFAKPDKTTSLLMVAHCCSLLLKLRNVAQTLQNRHVAHCCSLLLNFLSSVRVNHKFQVGTDL